MTESDRTQQDGGPSSAAAQARREVHSLHFTMRQAIKNTYSVWILALFIVAAGWRELPVWLSLGWVLLVGLTFSLRVRYLSHGRDLNAVEAGPALWRQRLIWSTLICGLVVALGPMLFFPLISETARMYMSMIFCGWLAGAMSSIGARPRLYAVYALIFASGVSAGWFRVGSESSNEVLVLLILFVVVTSGFARSFAAQVNESIEIRYANEQLVENLKTARAAAEESNAAKSRFLAVASHDLRQPLHAVTLLNGLFARPQSPEKISEISRQMGKALSTLERLFNSVLDFSKIDADKVKPDLAWHELSRVFAVLQASYAPQAAAKGLTLSFADCPVAVHTDVDLLERILRNLIENALKFTERGSIRVEAAMREQGLSISVTDTGPGIAANLREEIFKEYYQGGEGKSGSGLGLGLAIVRRLSGMLGLRVDVVDGESQGSRFVVSMPGSMVRSPTDTSPALAPQPRPSALVGFFVAYVDDDASSREALAMLLDDWGCRALVAESLDSLMRLLQDGGAPDAVLSDFSLAHGLTGLDVIEAVRHRFGPVSAAILTGDVSAIELEKLGELEYPVLRKPVPAHELKALLEVFKNIG